jgi:hypothetical protein
VQQTADASTVGATEKVIKMDLEARATMAAQADAYDIAAKVCEKAKGIVVQYDGKALADDEEFHKALAALSDHESPHPANFTLCSRGYVAQSAATVGGSEDIGWENGLEVVLEFTGPLALSHAPDLLPVKEIDVLRVALPFSEPIHAAEVCAALDWQAEANRAEAVALRGIEHDIAGYKDATAQLITEVMRLDSQILSDVPLAAREYFKLRLNPYSIAEDQKVVQMANERYMHRTAAGKEQQVHKDTSSPSLDEAAVEARAAVSRGGAEDRRVQPR